MGVFFGIGLSILPNYAPTILITFAIILSLSVACGEDNKIFNMSNITNFFKRLGFWIILIPLIIINIVWRIWTTLLYCLMFNFTMASIEISKTYKI